MERGLPLSLLVLALVLAACDGGSASNASTAAPTASAAPSTGPAGTDRDYVREFCAVDVAFSADLVAAAEDLLARGLESIGDPEVLTEVVVPPLRRYIADLRAVNPPADVRPYHDDLIEAMEAQVQLIETGGFDAEQLGDDPFAELVEPPPEIQSRLAAVAAEAPGCAGVSFFDQ